MAGDILSWRPAAERLPAVAVQSETAQRHELLKDWTQAPYARHCHPPGGEEHLLPLMVVAGAAHDAQGSKVYSEKIMETTISAFRFD